MEREVLQTANTVITVGKTLGNELVELGAKKCVVIHNGFDESDLPKEGHQPTLDTKFTIAHIGSMNKARNPNVLWQALSEIVKENSEFSKSFL